MADKEEKIIPEAEAAEEKAAPVAEEKVQPAKEEKKEETPKKKSKGGLIAGIVIAAVVVLGVAAFMIFAMLNGNQAKSLYNSGDYAQAYEKMEWSFFFVNQADKNVIAKDYAVKVLCEQGQYYQASQVLDKTTLTDVEKAAIRAKNGRLAMTQIGATVKFGKIDTDGDVSNVEDLEWIVIGVEAGENGAPARAVLMTKYVVDTPGGFSTGKNPAYNESQLHKWCNETFYNRLALYDVTLKEQIVPVTLSTQPNSAGISAGDPIEGVYAYSLAKEDIEKYLTGDMAQYVAASATKTAAKNGVTTKGNDKLCSYYLRNPGVEEKGTQWASVVDNNGKILESASISGSQTGARVVINVNLGASK